MLRISGSHRRLCDGVSRRDVLQACGLGALGAGAADWNALRASPAIEAASIPGFGKAKSVIMLFLYGGASQLETFDPKPEAPIEVRGKLGSIESSLPGCRVCEGLPNLARVMDRTTVVAAFLGQAYDPIWTDFEGEALHSQKYHFASTITTSIDPYGGVKPDCQFQWAKGEATPAELTLDRLSLRRSLLEQFDLARRDLDAQSRIREFSRTQNRAFAYLTNPRLRAALDLQRESISLREQYGLTLFGQSSLVARRLVEAGSRFVTVFWDEYGSVNSAWDTHYWHYPRLVEQLLPGLDRAYSALILDLEQRGLLDETLVLCITEHGRTPKLDPHGDHPSGTDQGGRNHWSRAYSSVLAGAGICRGKVVGRTDRIAGEVEETPVSPQDILATTYHLLGIDPHSLIHDRTGRPYAVGGNGRILHEVLAQG